ncbi:MAG: DMT family transporter [Nitrososphaerales archaeon]
MSTFLGVAASLGAALCWTATAALLKLGTTNVQPLLANTIRVIAATLGSILLVLMMGELDALLAPNLAAFSIALSAGLLGIVIGDTLYIYALKTAGVARVMPVANTYPLFSTLGAFLFLGEGLTPYIILGAVFIVAGLWLISPGRDYRDAGEVGFTPRSFFLTLSCAPIWAAGILLLGYALNYYSVIVLNAVRLPLIALILLGVAYARGLNTIRLSRHTVMILASAGLLGLTVGNILFLLGIDSIGVAKAVPLSSTSPIFSTIVGAVFLREKVSLRVYLSAVLIVLGIIQVTIG